MTTNLLAYNVPGQQLTTWQNWAFNDQDQPSSLQSETIETAEQTQTDYSYTPQTNNNYSQFHNNNAHFTPSSSAGSNSASSTNSYLASSGNVNNNSQFTSPSRNHPEFYETPVASNT